MYDSKWSIFPWKWYEYLFRKSHYVSTEATLELCHSEKWIRSIWRISYSEKVINQYVFTFCHPYSYPLEQIWRHMSAIGRWWCSIVVDWFSLCGDPDTCCDHSILISSQIEFSSSYREKCLIVGSTITWKSVSSCSIMEDIHPYINIIRCRGYYIYPHSSLLCKPYIVSTLLMHRSHEIRFRETQIEDPSVWCEEFFIWFF